jgi:hypothetical protein
LAIVDPPGKTRHCALMVLAAPVLAGNAPEQAQERALSRYTILWADSLLEWARHWRKEMSRSPDRATARHAYQMKSEVAHFADLLGHVDGVRDYLAAKRQPLAPLRADDIEATALMWRTISPTATNLLWLGAIELYDRLAQVSPEDSIAQYAALSFEVQDRVRAALPIRDPYWYLATDTGADYRPNTLPAAQGGELGRLVAQINDVALALDALLRIAPVLYGILPYDWLVRSALMVELAALLDLTVGSPPTTRPTGRPTLLDLCRYGRPTEAAADLTRMRDSISDETRHIVRWSRDKFGAHLDRRLPLGHLHDHLIQLDYQGMIGCAEHILDWLDALGAETLDLKMLLMGERRIGSLPLEPTEDDHGWRPDPRHIPGSLARLFRSIDSPYISGIATTMATGVLAGISAGRTRQPRDKITVPEPFDDRFTPIAPRINIRDGPASWEAGR